jgi:anaerobic selenocysteine-containing dehydrogenase
MATAFRICPLCEATCGLELETDGDRIVRVRGDREHVFSKGYLCPKGASFRHLVDDPDRVRAPLVRSGSEWREVSWPEAFAAVDAGLRSVLDTHGRDAVATYLGNPNAHTVAGGVYIPAFLRALRSRNNYSASTVDQMPKHVAMGYLYGDPLAISVPDIDRSDLVVLLGADPWESNGSMCTAPDLPGRLKALQARGGRFVVVDPRRSRTAHEADEHVFIRPGTDAFLLFGIVNVLFDDKLVSDVPPFVEGVEAVCTLAAPFAPDVVARRCGMTPEIVRRLAHEIAAAPRAAVYGRIGTTTVPFGTLTAWLVDVINTLTGNLDRAGGVMFARAAHESLGPRSRRGFTIGRWTSRVRGLPEVAGEIPASTLADEIETPGEGQVRALMTFAGNPALSNPNSVRLSAALASLEFMVSVDPYLNETTRHAHVILPPADPSRVPHYDFMFQRHSIRNVASFSPPVFALRDGDMDECEIVARLTMIVAGRGVDADLREHDDALLADVLARRGAPDGARALVTGDSGAERIIDALLRFGPYALTLDQLKASPHGIDLGPLEPRLPEMLRTQNGTVELCAQPIADDVPRLVAELRAPNDDIVLVGRRHVRSNNSWMHNLPTLVKGAARCTLHVHPEDAARLGLADGGNAKVASRVGSLVATVEVTENVMPGVVSLPHGWGHDDPEARLRVASEHAGVNSNVLTDEFVLDPLSGNAVLNGIPVTLEPV